jgi:hypothetical protein
MRLLHQRECDFEIMMDILKRACLKRSVWKKNSGAFIL